MTKSNNMIKYMGESQKRYPGHNNEKWEWEMCFNVRKKI